VKTYIIIIRALWHQEKKRGKSIEKNYVHGKINVEKVLKKNYVHGQINVERVLKKTAFTAPSAPSLPPLSS
jgi:hypothetical protein